MVKTIVASAACKPYASKHLSSFHLKSLLRLGDLYIPGTERLPSFSQSGCLHHVDIVMDGVHPGDLVAVRWLLVGLRFVPKWALRKLLGMMDRNDQYPEWLASPLRLVSLAIKGVIMSLYYSGLPVEGSQLPSVLNQIGYQLHCEPDNPDEDSSCATSV